MRLYISQRNRILELEGPSETLVPTFPVSCLIPFQGEETETQRNEMAWLCNLQHAVCWLAEWRALDLQSISL